MCSLRVSIHFTGRFSRCASDATIMSSGYELIFTPKPPPTSGQITRTAISGRRRVLAICVRTEWGFCSEV